MTKIRTHKIILNSDAGVYRASDYSVTFNLNNFLSQFPRSAVSGTTYRLGVDYFHNSANINENTINIRCVGFIQNKNRIYFGTGELNSDIIATIGEHETGTKTFNHNPNPPKLVEGYFSNSSLITINFVNELGTAQDWGKTTSSAVFQLNLIVEIESQE